VARHGPERRPQGGRRRRPSGGDRRRPRHHPGPGPRIRRRNAVIPLYLIILGGLCAGGRRAALRQPLSPLTHGALAALTAYVSLVVAILLIQLALGREMADPVSLVFNGLMAASAGMFGGYLAATAEGRAT
jgi:hypothetical protein